MPASPDSLQLIRTLHLKKAGRYIIFIPHTTGLDMSKLSDINEEINKYLHIRAIMIMVDSTDGLLAVEDKRKEDKLDESRPVKPVA